MNEKRLTIILITCIIGLSSALSVSMYFNSVQQSMLEQNQKQYHDNLWSVGKLVSLGYKQVGNHTIETLQWELDYQKWEKLLNEPYS